MTATPDGSKAATDLRFSDYYAYGYDVAVAQNAGGSSWEWSWRSTRLSGPPSESPWMPAIMTVSSQVWEERQKEKNHMLLRSHIITEITVLLVKAGGKYDDVTRSFRSWREQAVRLPHSLEPAGYRYLDQIDGAETGSETMRQHQSALWQSPTELQMSVLWIFLQQNQQH